MLDDTENRFESLEIKIEELETRLQNIESQGTSQGSEESAPEELASSSVQFSGIVNKVHWIDPAVETTTFADNGCEDITSVADAEKAFKEAALYRSDLSNGKPNVLHGDMMVLLCNTSPTSDDDDDDTTPGIYTDACFFMGLCITTTTMTQDPLADDDLKIVESIEVSDQKIHQFLAWSSCGQSESYNKVTVKACIDGESQDIEILTVTDLGDDTDGSGDAGSGDGGTDGGVDGLH